MVSSLAVPPLSLPKSVDEALDLLHVGGAGAVPVAGATWVMRAPLRHEPTAESFVSLSRIDGLRRLELGGDAITIGPMVTHDRLARDLPDESGLRVLALAAGRAANPGVRRLATIGGNICTDAFAASDFAPALLSLDARVEIKSRAGSEQLSFEDFLTRRADRTQPWLVTAITVPRASSRVSAHERLPMRKAGDYPCAIVSVSVAVDGNGCLGDARIGVGAVERSARRWPNLEAVVQGREPVPAEIEGLAKSLLADFSGRDAVDAPGWYRLAVLPVLIRRAFESINADLAARHS